MLLFFAEDKVADEISCIVWVYHRALLGASSCLYFARIFGFIDYFDFLVLLQCESHCILAANKPVGCRLYKDIATPCYVADMFRRLYSKDSR